MNLDNAGGSIQFNIFKHLGDDVAGVFALVVEYEIFGVRTPSVVRMLHVSDFLIAGG
jgi:hypothetical protein